MIDEGLVACSCWSRWDKPSGNQFYRHAQHKISVGLAPAGSQLMSYVMSEVSRLALHPACPGGSNDFHAVVSLLALHQVYAFLKLGRMLGGTSGAQRGYQYFEQKKHE